MPQVNHERLAGRFARPEAFLGGLDVATAAQLVASSADVVLLLDVLEHLGDPFSFLERLRPHSRYAVFHIPLDLSAISVLRESPLLHVRERVGHIHYYTRKLALAMLEECGYEIIEARYTGAALNAPRRSLKTRLAGLARKAVFAVNHDMGARLMGGETLLVLAAPKVSA